MGDANNVVDRPSAIHHHQWTMMHGEEKNQSDSLAMTSCNLKYFYEITMGKGAGGGEG